MEEVVKEDHHEDVKISSLEPAGRNNMRLLDPIKTKASPCKNECRSQKNGRTYPFVNKGSRIRFELTIFRCFIFNLTCLEHL